MYKLPVFIFLLLSTNLFSQWDDTDRLPSEFHSSRREALRMLMPDKSVAVFFSNPVRNRSNDVDYQYSQNPDFYYLSGHTEPNAMLFIFKEEQIINQVSCKEILFIQSRNPQQEIWNGTRLGINEATKLLGLTLVINNYEFENLEFAFASMSSILVNFPDAPNSNLKERMDLKKLVEAFKNKTTIYSANYDQTKLTGFMSQLREVKLLQELALMQKAIDMTNAGFAEMIKAIEPGFTEYQAQAIVEFYMKKSGSEYPGYPSIVGGGRNSCVLHYVLNRKQLAKNDLLLVDMGAEYHGYTADITRTIPVSGHFSDEQKIIYQLVYDAQALGIKECKPGNPFRAPHNAALSLIAQGLKNLGIISNESDVNLYFMHGTSHYLGLDVHDPGTFGPLKPNSVITVEPGIYIPENSPCDKKWWNIGVRIEDDVLITETGHKVLSEALPSTIEGIEKLMREESPFTRITKQ